ncbi:MAG: peptidoglycan-associated lipoprotein Pal [Candidatus Sumerlaeota bacterium]|nr:peptidoglycan-associated lipoprotein Pal [Candidatus Sumerlaeota bacterium]
MLLKVEKSRLLNAVLLLLIVGLFNFGCAKLNPFGIFGKKKPSPSVIYPSTDTNLPSAPEAAGAKTSTNVNPLPIGETGVPTATPMRMEATKQIEELQTVYFDFDSAALTDAAKATLDKNAEWLSTNPGVHVLIEGHCDERGTVEYNLNLGQLRSDSVREYFISKNLDPATLHTISYGKERPIDEGHNEEAWAKNRRVQFMAY